MYISNERVVTAKPRIVRPGMWRLSIAGCSLCIRFGTYIVIARALGTQSFGTLLFMQWIAALLLPLVGVGMTPVASRRIAEIQHRETTYSIAGIFHLLWRRQCHRVLLYCLLYIPLAFVLSLVLKGTVPFFLLLIAGFSAIPLLLSSVASITLQGLRRYDLLAALRLFSTLLNFCITFAVIQEKSESLSVLLLVPAFTSIVMLTIALVCVAKLLPLRKALELGPLLREHVERDERPSLLLFVLDSVVWRELIFLVLILIQSHTLSVLGFYVFSMLLCTHLVEVAPALFVTCILPLLSRFFPIRHYTDTYDAFIKTSSTIALVAVSICTLISICCPLIITVCLGTAYLPMVTPLRVLLIAVVFGSISTVSLTYLTHHEHKREQVGLGIKIAALHIGLALPCILLWGIIGAAIASTIAHIASTTGTVLICRKLLLRR